MHETEMVQPAPRRKSGWNHGKENFDAMIWLKFREGTTLDDLEEVIYDEVVPLANGGVTVIYSDDTVFRYPDDEEKIGAVVRYA